MYALTSRVLVALAALLVLAALPSRSSAQTVSPTGVDVHGFGLSPADRAFGGADAFGAPSAFGGNSAFGGSTYGSPFAGPGSYSSCPGSFMFMFGSAPGRFNYGWYSSPWDSRYSRNWLTPWQPAWGFWAHHYGFGYGSRVGSYGYNPWSPWSSVRSGCGFASPGRGYGTSYWGFGPHPYPLGPVWGSPYGPEWGQDYYPGSWRSFTPAGPPRYVAGGSTRARPSANPRATRDDVVEAGRERPGTRVIESRPETGGADLRRVYQDRADVRTRETITDAMSRARARATERRTEVVEVPLHPVAQPGPASVPRQVPRAGQSKRSLRPARNPVPRATQPKPEVRSTPRATSSGTQPKSRATQPRSRPVPRAMPRPARSTQPRAEPRSTPASASRSGSKGRPRQ